MKRRIDEDSRVSSAFSALLSGKNLIHKRKQRGCKEHQYSSAAANLLAAFFPLVLFPPLVDDPDVDLLVLAPRFVVVVRVVVRDFVPLVPPSGLGHATRR